MRPIGSVLFGFLGDKLSPSYYLILSAVISLIVFVRIKETLQDDVD